MACSDSRSVCTLAHVSAESKTSSCIEIRSMVDWTNGVNCVVDVSGIGAFVASESRPMIRAGHFVRADEASRKRCVLCCGGVCCGRTCRRRRTAAKIGASGTGTVSRAPHRLLLVCLQVWLPCCVARLCRSELSLLPTSLTSGGEPRRYGKGKRENWDRPCRPG
jgi:hypothetical protein